MFVHITTPPCTVCSRTSTLRVPEDGAKAWQNGALIQNALPGLTVDEREMLISGTHPDCWDILFPPPE